MELRTHLLTQRTLHQHGQDTTSPELYSRYLTTSEADQIRKQFEKADNGRKLLFWTNVPQTLAQAWADVNDASTLSTMMGPLMDEVHSYKKGKNWSKYVKGVSCLFAELARQKSSVLVLTTPPGVPRFRKESTFRSLEEPILKSSSSLRIDYVHPTVHGAETVQYSRWPVDNTSFWLERFGKEKPTDPAELLKQIRKGKNNLHFSLGRLNMAEVMSESRDWRRFCYVSFETVWGVSILLLQYIQDASSLVRGQPMFHARRLVDLPKNDSYRLTHQAMNVLRVILAARISFVDRSPGIVKVSQKDAATQTLQEDVAQFLNLERPIVIQASHTPDNPLAAAVVPPARQQAEQAKASKVKQIPVKPKAKSSAPVPQSSLQKISPQPLSVEINDANRKKITCRLGVFASLLNQHSHRTNKPVKYNIQQSGTTSTVTLSYAGLNFKAQAPGKALAKRLAAQQACRHFNIA